MVSVTIISLTTVVFGIASLILATKARSKLSPSSIRSYIDNLSICLVFIVLFSIWQTIRTMIDFDLYLGDLSSYPEFIFIILAYLGFIIASYRVIKIGQEFGFKEEGEKISRIIRENKKSRKEK